MNSKIFKYILAIILLSCNNQPHQKYIEGSKEKRVHEVSLTRQHETIIYFKNEIDSTFKLAKEYNLMSVSDSLLKYIYILNGSDTLITKNNLTIDQTLIQLTRLNQLDGSIFEFHYTFFMSDSIPFWPSLLEGRGSAFHSFEYDTAKHKIVKAHLGQETSYILGKDINKWYQKKVASHSFDKYISYNKKRFHPIYLRLL